MFDVCWHSMGMERQASRSTLPKERNLRRQRGGPSATQHPVSPLVCPQEPTKVYRDRVFPGDGSKMQHCIAWVWGREVPVRSRTRRLGTRHMMHPRHRCPAETGLPQKIPDAQSGVSLKRQGQGVSQCRSWLYVSPTSGQEADRDRAARREGVLRQTEICEMAARSLLARASEMTVSPSEMGGVRTSMGAGLGRISPILNALGQSQPRIT
jgi:hypothetical protein